MISVGVACLNQSPLDWQGNFERIKMALSQFKKEGVSIACLPELCLTGYGCEDFFLSDDVHTQSLQQLDRLLPYTQGLFVPIGLPITYQNKRYNAIAVLADQQLLGFVCKKILANTGIHYEHRWFSPWPMGITKNIMIQNKDFPIGDLLFNVNGYRIGFEICEEAWVDQRVGTQLSQDGVDLILNPSASHFAFGKHLQRQRLVCEGSKQFEVAYLYANQLGCESGRAIYDGRGMIAQQGHLIAQSTRLSFQSVQTISSHLDLKQKNKPSSGTIKEISMTLALPSPNIAPSKKPDIYTKNEAFLRVVALGLFDYLRKTKAHGYVVSLSGGVDSAATACLVYYMVHLSIDELGLETFKSHLSHINSIQDLSTTPALTATLLTCVYQKTNHSSQTTFDAAQHLTKALDATFHHLDIQPIVDAYINTLSSATNTAFSWGKHDSILQNIQARSRAPSAWLLANLKGAILLSTANRNEAAVGYCTMDGDTAGGLAPIAGVDKPFLMAWLKWLETEGPDLFGPLPILSLVTKQSPTAELRPPSQNQTDESDLMPYRVLNAIEYQAVELKKSRTNCQVYILEKFKVDYSPKSLTEWVDRFYLLFKQNQWKRERLAPSFHLDTYNLDPKTGARFPIL